MRKADRGDDHQSAGDSRRPQRLYTYHKAVKVPDIREEWDESHNYRWYITLPLRRPGAELAVLMMNPSWTDPGRCDRTVWNVQTFVCNSPSLQDVGSITIVNLFAFRDVSSKALAGGRASGLVGAENDRWLEAVFRRAARVIIACGKVPGPQAGVMAYLDRMRAVRALLDQCGQQARCVAETRDGYPLHARRWLEEQYRKSQMPQYSWAACTKGTEQSGVSDGSVVDDSSTGSDLSTRKRVSGGR
ncbi:MAG TPA: DUF1643 domain-containing protein [Archangium sp.]|uniref:DUF1643 domain-containing protein n=1 Tax=Archangium sp. TaxID=1872627 RepID=UPI002E37C445|nr:DUF1643 domain-containing protein [Archangium sp.]HEX5747647.1 DUF1643 domain-containing protein [Archangium sp.]